VGSRGRRDPRDGLRGGPSLHTLENIRIYLVATEKKPWSEHYEVSGGTRLAEEPVLERSEGERPRRGEILLFEALRPSLGDRAQRGLERVRNRVQRAESAFFSENWLLEKLFKSDRRFKEGRHE